MSIDVIKKKEDSEVEEVVAEKLVTEKALRIFCICSVI
jgi:hypothetical protein